MPRIVALIFLLLSPALSLGQSGSLVEQLKQLGVEEIVAQATKNGDAKRGAILFHQPHLQCSKCHAVNNGEAPLGPNLAVWKEPVEASYLIESILEPSKKIREGYETVSVLTVDDVVITGILVSENADELVLRDASGDGRATRFSKDELERVAKSTQSVMPEGVVGQLASLEQFYDLARYVIEIARQGPQFAASVQPPTSLTQLPPLPEYEAHVAHAEMIEDFDIESLRRGKKIYSRVCANCHGTHDQEGSLLTSPKFASAKLKNGHDPYRMYQTLTHGHGLMVAQRWMVPQQKYDVINFIREDYFKDHNPELFTEIDSEYLASLPEGDTRGPEPSRFDNYVNMDYGPSLNHTYEILLNNSGDNIGRDLGRNPKANDPWANPDEYFAPGEAPNYAYKGIAVRLDAGPGGVSRGSHWVVYDHDTMNMHAAWSGSGFIDWCCIQFDGQHNVHNRLTGEIHIESSVGPGWGQPLTGVLRDPRPLGRDGRPYGPLPSAWYKYKGLYHHDQKTILSYRVGTADVLESPSVIQDEAPVFVRQLSIGRAPHKLRIRLCPEETFAYLHVGEEVSSDGLRLSSVDGYKTLEIDEHDDTLHLQVLLSELAIPEDLELDQPEDLVQYTRGGPPRWPERVKTRINTVFDEIFAVDELSLPTANPWNAQVRATGLDFFADNQRLALCTWDGDVWLVDGIAQDQGELTWQRVASGMFQPLGLKIVDEQIYVTCRDQLVILRDLNGDNETDFYECFNSDHHVTEHFHEFAMGLQRDEQGNFYYAKSGRHAKRAVVPHHGTLLKVSPDGSHTEILATGFRAANGVCLNPDGSFFVTDQEGHWNPKNRINWVTPGGFYGNLYGFTDITDPANEAMLQPLCWITNKFDRSPAELLWVPEDAWGPFGGGLLNLSYGYGKVYVVPHELLNGQLQGGMCQLPIPDMPSGLIRGRFHPVRNDLYACGMFSWAGSRQAPGCFHRIRYNGAPAHLPLELRAKEGIVEIGFSHTLDTKSAAQASNYVVKAWDLKRTPNYGSDHYNEREWKVAAASLAADGKTVSLSIPDLAPTWGMSIEYDLAGQDGRPFHGLIHNSIHNLKKNH